MNLKDLCIYPVVWCPWCTCCTLCISSSRSHDESNILDISDAYESRLEVPDSRSMIHLIHVICMDYLISLICWNTWMIDVTNITFVRNIPFNTQMLWIFSITRSITLFFNYLFFFFFLLLLTISSTTESYIRMRVCALQ